MQWTTFSGEIHVMRHRFHCGPIRFLPGFVFVVLIVSPRSSRAPRCPRFYAPLRGYGRVRGTASRRAKIGSKCHFFLVIFFFWPNGEPGPVRGVYPGELGAQHVSRWKQYELMDSEDGDFQIFSFPPFPPLSWPQVSNRGVCESLLSAILQVA